MKPKQIVVIILALTLLWLSGCGLIDSIKGTQTDMDDLLRQVMACLERKSAEDAAELCENPAAARQFIFPRIISQWPVKKDDPFECRQMTVHSYIRHTDEEYDRIAEAIYVVHSEDGDREVYMVVCMRDDYKVIRTFDVERIEASDSAAGETWSLLDTLKPRIPERYLFRVICAAALLFVLITIIDVIRRKPKRYGLWILLSLVFAVYLLRIGPDRINMTFQISLLTVSDWVRTANGTDFFQLGIPAGALAYWIWRAVNRNGERKSGE